MSKNKPAIDKLGQEIKVGSYIGYGHALGRCAGLRIGKVLDIQWKKDPYSSAEELEPSFIVWGIDDDWSSEKPKLCMTRGKLSFGNRMIVLPDSMVPESYRNMLHNVTLATKGTTWAKEHAKKNGHV